MAAPTSIGLHSRQAGNWERIDNAQTRVADSWVPVVRALTKVAGVWKATYVSHQAEINGGTITIRAADSGSGPYSTTAAVFLDSNGETDKLTIPQAFGPSFAANWKTFEYGRLCEVKWDFVSQIGAGTPSRSPAMNEGQWYDMNTQREWYFTTTKPSLASYRIELTIRNKAEGASTEVVKPTFLSCENGFL